MSRSMRMLIPCHHLLLLVLLLFSPTTITTTFALLFGDLRVTHREGPPPPFLLCAPAVTAAVSHCHPGEMLLLRRRPRRSIPLRMVVVVVAEEDEEKEDEEDEKVDDLDDNYKNVPSQSQSQHYSLFESSTSSMMYYEERRPVRQQQRYVPSPPPALSSTSTSTPFQELCRIQKQQRVAAAALPDVVRLDPQPEFPHTIEALTEQAVRAIREACRRDPTARIGFDIQGLPSIRKSITSTTSSTEYSAMRQWALHLAATLSTTTSSSSDSTSTTSRIPISIYCNTVKQALMASRELLWLKRIEKHHFQNSQLHESRYDRIQIRCLVGDHPMIPPDMLFQHDDTSSTHRQKRQQQPPQNKNLRGLILVVQPTDYNDEYAPPGPAVNVWTALQGLVASAAVEGLPVVCLSPQSRHPPTPWVLRDFLPPVLSWNLHVIPSSIQQPRQQQSAVVVWRGTKAQQETADDDDDATSRWHVFSRNRSNSRSNIPMDGGSIHRRQQSAYYYLASCRETPTAQRLRHLVREYEIS